MAATRIRKLADWAVIVVFLGAIALPLLGALLPVRSPQSANDLRELAALPQLRLKGSALKAFPAQFEQYWNDHFAFRGSLIGALNIAKVRWLHVSTSAHVLLGRASWLFYTPEPVGRDHDCIRPFTPYELERWRRVLEHRHDWLARRGCRYLLFIPPDKQTIYPEYADPNSLPKHERTRLDQLIEYLQAHHSPVEAVDIRPALRVAKQHERLYHRTDSHWNDRGAFVGYTQVAAALAKGCPVIEPLPRSAFCETTDTRGGDLAMMVGLAEREDWLRLEPRSPWRARMKEDVVWPAGAVFPLGKPFATECDDARLPRAVVFHDSFMLALYPFLSQHFRRAAFVWQDDFYPEVVERERPDIVLQELLERKLGTLTPRDFDEAD
jgi:hypothetical protein